MGINGSYVMRTLPRCGENIKNDSAAGSFIRHGDYTLNVELRPGCRQLVSIA
jgi:hypothetical protein